MEQGFDDLLRSLGLKVTPRRLAILEVMAAESVFLSADQVWKRVKDRVARLGLPTVYRILEELASPGVVTRVIHGNKQLFYYFCGNDTHHHHFVCLSCHKVEDIDLCVSDNLTQEVSRRINAIVLSHILQLQGLCRGCTLQEGKAR